MYTKTPIFDRNKFTMKYKILTAAVVVAFSFASCNNKKETTEETGAVEVVDTTSTPVTELKADSTATPVTTQEHKDDDVIEVTGEVTEINQGKDAKLAVLENGVTLQDLVTGLNKLGVGPRDIITILQAIKAAGALQAEIETM